MVQARGGGAVGAVPSPEWVPVWLTGAPVSLPRGDFGRSAWRAPIPLPSAVKRGNKLNRDAERGTNSSLQLWVF